MILYAVKCSEGYLKKGVSGLECVSIDKAAVYPDLNAKAISEIITAGKSLGLKDLRVTELTLTEKDYLQKYE